MDTDPGALIFKVQFETTPFGVTPNPAMIFPSAGFQEAKEAVVEALATGKGFAVVTGEVGAGKTTLMRTILANMPSDMESAVILNTGLGPDDLLLALAHDLNLTFEGSRGRREMIAAIEERLLKTFSDGKTTAVFIDEAQHLSDESLELLRMLSNLETESEKIVQIILFGQVELRDNLGRPELRQLRSRIAVHRHLEPLTAAETTAYVVHLISLSGPSQPVFFNERALRLLHRKSEGYPRRINLIGDLSLRLALAAESLIITDKHVRNAAAEMATLDPSAVAPMKSRLAVFSHAAAWTLLAVAVVGVLHQQYRKFSADRIVPIMPPPAVEPVQVPVVEEAPRPVEEPATPRAATPGALLSALFLRAGVDPGMDATALEHARLEMVAHSAGLHWIEIPPRLELLRGIGLPVFTYIENLEGVSVAALLVPDRSDTSDYYVEIFLSGAKPSRMRWDAVALGSRPASLLLPGTAWSGNILGLGSQHPDVGLLQNRLHQLGLLDSGPIGLFDFPTLKAVERFQALRGIPEDGVAGPWTFSALYAACERPFKS